MFCTYFLEPAFTGAHPGRDNPPLARRAAPRTEPGERFSRTGLPPSIIGPSRLPPRFLALAGASVRPGRCNLSPCSLLGWLGPLGVGACPPCALVWSPRSATVCRGCFDAQGSRWPQAFPRPTPRALPTCSSASCRAVLRLGLTAATAKAGYGLCLSARSARSWRASCRSSPGFRAQDM